MPNLLAAPSALFRDRDLFVHDGTKLRRMRVTWRAQALFAMFIGILVAFSSYSLVRFLSPTQTAAVTSQIPAAMVRLAAATEQRVNEMAANKAGAAGNKNRGHVGSAPELTCVDHGRVSKAERQAKPGRGRSDSARWLVHRVSEAAKYFRRFEPLNG